MLTTAVPTKENLASLQQAKNDLHAVLLKEENIWRQRSRIQWIRSGDKNTKFFHSRALARKRKNKISRLQDDTGAWHEGRDEVMEVVLTYFHELFTTSEPSLLEEAIAGVEREVSEEMNQFLAMLFIALEVKKELFQMGAT